MNVDPRVLAAALAEHKQIQQSIITSMNTSLTVLSADTVTLLLKLSADPQIIKTLQTLSQEQHTREQDLLRSRNKLLERFEQEKRVVTARHVINSTVNSRKHNEEKTRMNAKDAKELLLFDTQIMAILDGLVTSQQLNLNAMIPGMFQSESREDIKMQRTVIQLLLGMIKS